MAEQRKPNDPAARGRGPERRYAVTVKKGHITGARSRSGIDFSVNVDTIVPESRMTDAIRADEWLVVRDADEPYDEPKPVRGRVELEPLTAAEHAEREQEASETEAADTTDHDPPPESESTTPPSTKDSVGPRSVAKMD